MVNGTDTRRVRDYEKVHIGRREKMLDWPDLRTQFLHYHGLWDICSVQRTHLTINVNFWLIQDLPEQFRWYLTTRTVLRSHQN